MRALVPDLQLRGIQGAQGRTIRGERCLAFQGQGYVRRICGPRGRGRRGDRKLFQFERARGLVEQFGLAARPADRRECHCHAAACSANRRAGIGLAGARCRGGRPGLVFGCPCQGFCPWPGCTGAAGLVQTRGQAGLEPGGNIFQGIHRRGNLEVDVRGSRTRGKVRNQFGKRV